VDLPDDLRAPPGEDDDPETAPFATSITVPRGILPNVRAVFERAGYEIVDA